MGFPALRAPAAAPSVAAPQVFTQNLTASLSFIGSFAASRFFLRSFSAQLLSSGGAAFPTTNLVSYWKLDETSGTRIDSFGSNHLSDNNSVGSTTGIQGNAASFTAASSRYLSCASNSSLQMGNIDFTISAWVKLTSTAHDNSLVTKDDDAANSRDYTLDQSTTGSLGFRFYSKGLNVIQSSGIPTVGQWYFLVAWFDTSNGQAHLRINDTNQIDSVTGLIGTDVSSAQFRIGAREYAGFEDYADAVIDEVGIWKRVLTGAEITALYNGGAGVTYGGGLTGPAATLTRLPRKVLAATFSPIAALSRRMARVLSATLSFAATLTKRIVDSGFTATLSFIGNLAVSKTFVRALSATLNFTGALSSKMGKALSATLSFAGAITRRLVKSLTATLSFVAAFTKKYLDAGFSATLSFIGNLAVSKTFVRALSATLNLTSVLNRRTGKVLSATLSFVGTIAKNIRKSLSATLSFVGNLVISKLFVRAFTATLSFTGAVGRQVGKALSATLSFIGALATSFIAGGGHLFLQSYTATLSFAGAIAKLPRKNFAAALLFIGALVKSIRDAGFTATLSFVGFLSISRAFLRSFAATLSFTGLLSVSKSFLKAFTATLSFTGALSRRAGKAFSATLSVAASLIKRVAHTLSAILAPVGALVKAIRDAGFTATLSFAGALTTAAVHFFTRSFTATLSFAGNLARSRTFARALAATLNMTGALRRQLQKSLAATLSFSGALRKAIRKGLAAVLSFAVFFFKGGAVEILAGLVTKAGALIALAGSTARISRAGSQLDVREAESGAEIPITGSQLRVERTK